MKDFECFNVGTDSIDVGEPYAEMKPTKMFIKQDGDMNDNPSLCFVLEHPEELAVVIGQLSVKMFNEGLKDIGYKLERI